MESHTQIERQAAEWLAKRDGHEWTERDAAALKNWTDASIAHRIAFLRIEAAWEETLRLKALTAGLPADAGAMNEWRVPVSFDESPEEAPQINAPNESIHRKTSSLTSSPLPSRERAGERVFHVSRALLAAGFLLTIGSAAFFGSNLLQSDRYTTPIGGIASVPLQDGSKITLNTASAVRIELSAAQRRVELDRGEAFFEVAKDPNRPFIVTVGKRRVVVLGTQFSIRRSGDDLHVVVTEGAVRIDDDESINASSVITAGNVARAGADGILVQKKPLPEATELLSWRAGYLTFSDTPLADAVAEFNRYNTRAIVIDDASIAKIPLTGKFKPTNYQGFIGLLQDGYRIKIQRMDDKIVLSAP